MNLTEVATSGPVLLALLLSVAAGVVSFASPCVVPLVPGYLAYLAGLVGADAPVVTEWEARTQSAVATAAPPRVRRFRVAGAAALFVAGFTVVFVVGLGSIVWLADALLANEALLQRIGGVVTVAMGLVFLGLVPALQRDTRPHRVPRLGLAGAPLLGATFGLGWTPASVRRWPGWSRWRPAPTRVPRACAGSSCCWPTASGSACPSCSSPSAPVARSARRPGCARTAGVSRSSAASG